MRLKVKLLDGGIMPSRAKEGDAGLDLRAAWRVVLHAGEIQRVRVGFAAEIDPGWCAVLRDRSGLGSRGVHVLAGVIDHTYRGEWQVVLCNLGMADVVLDAGDRIAQALFVPVPPLEIEQVSELGSSERGEGGFGSTGR